MEFAIIGIGISVVTAVVTATAFVTSRPSRTEVNEMIDTKVNQRFDALEKSVDEVKADVKILLQRSAAQKARKGKEASL